MARLAIDRVRERAARAFERKARQDGLTDEVLRHVLPGRSAEAQRGQGPVQVEIYDSTSQASGARFANRMQADFMPAYQRNFELQPGPLLTNFPDLHDEMVRNLEPVNAVINALTWTGGFVSACHECFQDLIVGRMVLAVMEGQGRDPVDFFCIPQHTVALEDGPTGKPWGVYEKRTMKGRMIKELWPDAELPAELVKKIDNQDDLDCEVLVAFYYDQKDRLWFYDVLFGDKKDGGRIVEREYQTQAMIPSRWLKAPGDPCGYGPGTIGLPDMRVLNAVQEMALQAAALAIAGVYLGRDDGVLNPDMVVIEPNAVIPVGMTGPQRSLEPLETGRNFDIAQFVSEDLRVQIRKVMLDNQLPPDTAAVKSATEILQRMKELAQDTGAAFGRLADEFVEPLVERLIEIAFRKGLISTKVELNPLLVRVQILSPLARLQKIADVEAVVQVMMIAREIGGEEGALLAVKVEDLIPWIAEQLGMLPRFIRTAQERAEIQQTIGQAAAQQMQQPEIPVGEGQIKEAA